MQRSYAGACCMRTLSTCCGVPCCHHQAVGCQCCWCQPRHHSTQQNIQHTTLPTRACSTETVMLSKAIHVQALYAQFCKLPRTRGEAQPPAALQPLLFAGPSLDCLNACNARALSSRFCHRCLIIPRRKQRVPAKPVQPNIQVGGVRIQRPSPAYT